MTVIYVDKSPTNSYISMNSIYTASDYEHGVYQFVIQPMQQQVTIPIRIIDDATVEELREQFSVSVSFQAQPGLSLGNSQGTITIIDNDGNLVHLIVTDTF